MEREAVLVAIDVGTSKVSALIGEVMRDGRINILGHGTVPSAGLKKGNVVNIDMTVRSIRDAVERAERLSGFKIDRAFVNVSGEHVESLNSPGTVAVTGHSREVTKEDVNRAIEVARAVTIPSNREVLHVERRDFTVDGQEGVKEPLGMSALRLTVETHIITGSATNIQNLTKCVQAAGVKLDELVVSSLAAAETVLSETEKDLGVAVADMGSGTIDLALFHDGSPYHTAVIPVGGLNVTNDITSIVMTSQDTAEALKVRYGSADPAAVDDPDEEIELATVGGEAERTVSRAYLNSIIEARMRETFELVRDQVVAGGSGRLPAGLVLTGGAAQLAGVASLGREVLALPVRVAGPTGVGGLVETLLDPAHATSIGLLEWGAAGLGAEPSQYESAPAGGMIARARDALRGLFP